MDAVPFADLRNADLVVDRVYRGGTAGNRGDDPIGKLLPVGNAGGFRFAGSPTKGNVRLLALYTSSADADWPDSLDLATGTFTYYGDNKQPGKELHETPRKGNHALRVMFEDAMASPTRGHVPPIFLFEKAGSGADVIYRGMLVPGSVAVPADEQLVAIWRSRGNARFQNYRASFSVLNVKSVSREWLSDLASGQPSGGSAPRAWLAWQRTGIPDRLLAPRTIEHRTRDQQMPSSKGDLAILQAVHSYFSPRPHDFEACAAQIWMMLAPATEELVLTQPSRDGGRDAVGLYRIGPPDDRITIDFALEAKCYAPHSSVGVREMSRLISRLRHRNFGVMVTTSWVNTQAYREVRDDRHPVAIVSGVDIVKVLKQRGLSTPSLVQQWLASEFPKNSLRSSDITFDPLVALELPDLMLLENDGS